MQDGTRSPTAVLISHLIPLSRRPIAVSEKGIDLLTVSLTVLLTATHLLPGCFCHSQLSPRGRRGDSCWCCFCRQFWLLSFSVLAGHQGAVELLTNTGKLRSTFLSPLSACQPAVSTSKHLPADIPSQTSQEKLWPWFRSSRVEGKDTTFQKGEVFSVYTIVD